MMGDIQIIQVGPCKATFDVILPWEVNLILPRKIDDWPKLPDETFGVWFPKSRGNVTWAQTITYCYTLKGYSLRGKKPEQEYSAILRYLIVMNDL